MKYTITFNVLRTSGLPSAARISVDVRNVGRESAITAARLHIGDLGVRFVEQPCSVRSSAAPKRAAARRPKVRLDL